MNKKINNRYLMIILGAIVLIIGIYIILCNYNERVLRKEINSVVSKDIDAKYEVKCKTIFGYCDIEEAIENYMSEYSTKLSNIKKVSTDKQLADILSVNNYKTDGPKFEKSLKYLTDTLDSYNKDSDSLIKMSDKKYLNDYIKNYTKSNKYIKLYKEIVNESKIYEKVDNVTELENNKKSVNNTIKVSAKVLEFLRDNANKWKIEDNMIKFNNYKLLDKYNAYLKKLK